MLKHSFYLWNQKYWTIFTFNLDKDSWNFSFFRSWSLESSYTRQKVDDRIVSYPKLVFFQKVHFESEKWLHVLQIFCEDFSGHKMVIQPFKETKKAIQNDANISLK